MPITESTVSRRICSVEKMLGFDLFERTPNGVLQTEACRKIYPYLSDAETTLTAGVEAASFQHNNPAGNIRLTTVPTLMNRIVIPAIQDFNHRYPNISLELLSNATDLSMMQRDADIAIRLSRPSTDLEAKTSFLGTLDYGVYAKRCRLGEEDHYQELAWVSYEENMQSFPHTCWISDQAARNIAPIASVRFNDAEGILSGIRAGLGKSLLPKLVGDKLTDLVELHEYENLPSLELWILYHPNLATTARLRGVIEWLKDVFSLTLRKN